MTGDGPEDPSATGRVLGIDLGTVRIGLALSDSRRTLASPYRVLRRAEDVARDHRVIAAVVEETGTTLVVVGLALSLSGAESTTSLAAREEAEALGSRLSVPVVLVDERLTTVEAVARGRELDNTQRAGRRRGRDDRRRRDRREALDAKAAAIILQSYLDARRKDGDG